MDILNWKYPIPLFLLQESGSFLNMWPALAKQGTSRMAQVSDLTCTVAGINMTNTIHSTIQNINNGVHMSLTNLKYWSRYWYGWLSLTINTLYRWFALNVKSAACRLRHVPCFARPGHIFKALINFCWILNKHPDQKEKENN